jgi:hypothetical protein
MKRIPVVFCEPYGKSSLRFWCEHCQGWHSHGAGGDDGGEGIALPTATTRSLRSDPLVTF